MSDSPRVTNETKVRRAIAKISKTQRTRHEQIARDRLDKASRAVAALIDSEIDPGWHESQELENAAIALGRLLNNADKEGK